jgi:hypothetical protein
MSSLNEVVVLEFETMDWSGPAKKARIISSADTLAKVLKCLQVVQSDGNWFKHFPKQTPTARVYFMHDQDKVFDLTIYGRIIKAPAPKNGSFGLKPYKEEGTLVSLLIGRKKPNTYKASKVK